MGQFLEKGSVKRISATTVERVERLVYLADDGTHYEIPVGELSDGLSVPRWAHWFQKPFGFGVLAGYLHDHILENPDIDMSFLEANDLFGEALKALGMSWMRRKVLELSCDLNGIVVHHNDKPS